VAVRPLVDRSVDFSFVMRGRRLVVRCRNQIEFLKLFRKPLAEKADGQPSFWLILESNRLVPVTSAGLDVVAQKLHVQPSLAVLQLEGFGPNGLESLCRKALLRGCPGPCEIPT